MGWSGFFPEDYGPPEEEGISKEWLEEWKRRGRKYGGVEETRREADIFDFTMYALGTRRVTWPISASSDDGAIFELLAQIGCRMPKEQSA